MIQMIHSWFVDFERRYSKIPRSNHLPHRAKTSFVPCLTHAWPYPMVKDVRMSAHCCLFFEFHPNLASWSMLNFEFFCSEIPVLACVSPNPTELRRWCSFDKPWSAYAAWCTVQPWILGIGRAIVAWKMLRTCGNIAGRTWNKLGFSN